MLLLEKFCSWCFFEALQVPAMADPSSEVVVNDTASVVSGDKKKKEKKEKSEKKEKTEEKKEKSEKKEKTEEKKEKSEKKEKQQSNQVVTEDLPF